MSWPDDRPVTYDETLIYDEDTGTWIDADGTAGSRYQTQLVVISDTGAIYFGSTE